MDDLMRAKDILSAIKRNKERIDPAEEDGGVITGYRLAHDQITEIINRCIPTVLDVKPVVRGKWGKDGDCPVCGYRPWYERDIHTLNYCPSCGADMREENHDNQR